MSSATTTIAADITANIPTGPNAASTDSRMNGSSAPVPYRLLLRASAMRSTNRRKNPITAAIHDRRTLRGSSWSTASPGRVRVRAVKLREEEARVPSPEGEVRAVVIAPVDGGRRPGVLLYTDILQLTASTPRPPPRLASSGVVLCLPE